MKTNKRLENFKEKINLPALIVDQTDHGGDVSYLTNVPGLTGYLLLAKQGDYLFSFDKELSRRANVDNVIQITKKRELKLLLKKLNVKSLRTNLDSYYLDTFISLKKIAKLSDCSKELRKMRQVKDKEEIDRISRACAITDKAMKIVHENIKPGITERKLNALACSVLSECDCNSFDSIIASGKNALTIHYPPTSKKIEKQELIIVDIGFRYNGYCADMTRTFAIDPTKNQKRIHAEVLEAVKRSVTACKPNVKCYELTEKLVKYFESIKEPYYAHYLGHGIGLEVHESPSFHSNSKDVIKEGMTFTIEPGIHDPVNGGCRIEDTFLMRKGKLEPLTKFPRGLEV